MSAIAGITGRLAAILEFIVKWAAIVLLTVLVCAVFFQVARRTLVGKSIVEIEELSIMLAAWCAFMTVAFAARKKVHVRIEVFIEKLPFSLRNAAELLTHAAILTALLLIVYYGWRLAGRKVMVPMNVLPINQGYWYYSFPVGMLLTSFFMFDNVCQTLRRFRTREPYPLSSPADEAMAAVEGED